LVILAGIYRVPFEDFRAEKDAGGGHPRTIAFRNVGAGPCACPSGSPPRLR
jgi:hypothetical protein